MNHAAPTTTDREAELTRTIGVGSGGFVRVLRLNLKGCYFDAIKAGTKTHEYRLAVKWWRRLSGKTFDEIHLLRGYPKRGDESRILRRSWNGFTEETITHPHFGTEPVRVLAIDVSKHPNSEVSEGGSLTSESTGTRTRPSLD